MPPGCSGCSISSGCSMGPERDTPRLEVAVALVALGVALGVVSLHLGIVLGSSITRKQNREEIRRLRAMVVSMRAELTAWERGGGLQDRREGR